MQPDEGRTYSGVRSLSARGGKWLLVIAAIVVLSAVAVFWRVLRRAERAHIHRLTAQAMHAITADLQADLTDRTNALLRLAKVSALKMPPSSGEWRGLAAAFIEHHRGCIAVEYVDSSYQVRQIVSVDGDESELGRNLAADPTIWRTLDEARYRQGVVGSAVEFSPSGRKLRRVTVAVYAEDQFRGFIVVRIDIAMAIDAMLEDVSDLGYLTTVVEDGHEIYSLPGANRDLLAEWGQETTLELSPGFTWTVRAWPTPQLFADMQTRLPEIGLILGITLAALTLITLQLALTAGHRAAETEAANQALKNAICIRQRAEDALRQSQARFAGVLEMSADAIISTDEHQRITLFNKGAESIFGYKAEEVIGQKLDVLLPPRYQAAHRGHIHNFAAGQGHSRPMTPARMVLGLRKDGTEFPVDASISKLEINGERIYTAILRDVTDRQRAEEALRRAHEELETRVVQRTAELERINVTLAEGIAERKQAEEMLRQLSGRLLQLQDEERRRVARELHDSTAQYLAALALNISSVQEGSGALPEELRNTLADTLTIVDRCSAEIRTMSYLLHPPLLDDLGLMAALQWYAQGYAKRSGVVVELDIPGDLGRLPTEIERTFFRIVQESLTNIRKHSGADRAAIRMVRGERDVQLEVADNGRGMPTAQQSTEDVTALLGVGIAGMRERVRQLGGRLDIVSSSQGSVVRTRIPLPDMAVAESGGGTRDQRASSAAAGNDPKQ